MQRIGPVRTVVDVHTRRARGVLDSCRRLTPHTEHSFNTSHLERRNPRAAVARVSRGPPRWLQLQPVRQVLLDRDWSQTIAEMISLSNSLGSTVSCTEVTSPASNGGSDRQAAQFEWSADRLMQALHLARARYRRRNVCTSSWVRPFRLPRDAELPASSACCPTARLHPVSGGSDVPSSPACRAHGGSRARYQ